MYLRSRELGAFGEGLAVLAAAGSPEALLATVCDPRALLAVYNEIAAAHPRGDGDGEGLARWSPEFLASLRSGASPQWQS